MTQANGISRIEADASPRLQEFFALTKPRVVSLIVFTAVIGMFLAAPGMVALQPLVFGAIGIARVASSALAPPTIAAWIRLRLSSSSGFMADVRASP